MDGFKEALIISEGSEWRFEKFVKFTIATQKTKSVLGKSYIKLPKAISDKKACINIKNNDDNLYDLIIGNPPYFVCKKESIPKQYLKHISGRPNMFGLFILHSLSKLKKERKFLGLLIESR